MIRYPVEPGALIESDVFRRLMAWSAATHVGVALFFTFTPGLYRTPAAPTPVFVEVVASAATAARPRQVVNEPVVIPKRAPKKAVEKPEVVAKVVEKKPEAPALTPDQILAQLRRKHGETNPIEPAQASATHARLDPERAAYRRKLENLIYGNWAGARSFRHRTGLEVLLEVQVDAAGTLRSVRIVRSSGNRHLDESAERAIKRSAPFPVPPRSVRKITVRMNPRESA